MRRISLIRLVVVSLACAPLTAQSASRSHAPSAKAPEKNKATPLLPGKPIEPMEAPERTPAAGWSGFYFGVNAGAAASETNR